MHRPILSKKMIALTSVLLLSVVARAHGAEVVVDQHDLTFKPGSVAISAGDTVRFTDSDHIAHNITITSPDGTSLDKGMDTYGHDITVTFDQPGTFQAHCRIHPSMKMTITVK